MPLRDRITDEWQLGVDPAAEPLGGTHAEWLINWRDLGGSPTWQLEVFGDGIAGVIATDLPALLVEHEESGPDELRAALLADGWIDRTPRDDPYQT